MSTTVVLIINFKNSFKFFNIILIYCTQLLIINNTQNDL